MTDIWTSNKCSIFYFETITDTPHYGSCSEIEDINYQNDAGRCAYCGHELGNNLECPGCAARLSTGRSLVAGRASVILNGYLPMTVWLFRPIYKIELHIVNCGMRDNYNNWDAKIIFSNIQKTNQRIVGFSYQEANAIKAGIRFDCNVLIEERE